MSGLAGSSSASRTPLELGAMQRPVGLRRYIARPYSNVVKITPKAEQIGQSARVLLGMRFGPELAKWSLVRTTQRTIIAHAIRPPTANCATLLIVASVAATMRSASERWAGGYEQTGSPSRGTCRAGPQDRQSPAEVLRLSPPGRYVTGLYWIRPGARIRRHIYQGQEPSPRCRQPSTRDDDRAP